MAASLPAMTGSHCFEIRRDMCCPPAHHQQPGSGEVQVGDRELFVEVTGTDLAMVVLTLNILATNLADRGATIAHVQINYPGKTSLGHSFVTPVDLGKARSIHTAIVGTALGEQLCESGIGKHAGWRTAIT